VLPDRRVLQALAATVATLSIAAAASTAEDEFERPPISYSESTPSNAVERLQSLLDRGEARLAYDEKLGYLRSVLAALRVPVSSQTLVFSKTSLQQQRITPKNPRALYFNDDVYVGYVHAGDVIELSVADPALGTVFYTLDQKTAERPRFVRQTEECLICHGGSQTRGVPGHIVRSVYPDATGQPIFSAGSHRVDHTTPFEDRWGGWYVTGKHGAATHLGNITYRARPEEGAAGDTTGLNATDIRDRFHAAGYLTPDSDLVALMVLAHQANAHTIMAKASFDARQSLFREAALNRELKEPEDRRWPSTNTVLDGAAAALVECFLFCDEPPLTAPISGTTAFAEQFAAGGKSDSSGRSLRALDLQTRLFRNPCSFLVYSESFDALPAELRERFWSRMDAVLFHNEGGERFAHLSAADRAAIREILATTKPGAPAQWAAP
jgi:hypothetical protein